MRQLFAIAHNLETIALKLLRALPLAITVSRLALGPAFWALFKTPIETAGQVYVLLLIIAVAIVTDWMDGFLARRWDAVSLAGKLLDPFTDALFCMMVFLAFARHELMPMWLVLVLISRETLVTFVLRPLALRRAVVIAARMLGKYKTSFQFGLMVTILIWLIPRVPLAGVLRFLVQLGFYIVLALSVTSAAYYVADVNSALTGRKTAEAED